MNKIWKSFVMISLWICVGENDKTYYYEITIYSIFTLKNQKQSTETTFIKASFGVLSQSYALLFKSLFSTKQTIFDINIITYVNITASEELTKWILDTYIFSSSEYHQFFGKQFQNTQGHPQWWIWSSNTWIRSQLWQSSL